MRIKEIAKSNIDNFKLVLGISRTALIANKAYGTEFKEAFKRSFYLVKKHKFKPMESYRWGLLDPSLNEKIISGFVSKHKMSNVQNALNPKNWYYVTEDKSIFYRFCQERGFPIPELYGVFFRDHPDWLNDPRSPIESEDWVKTLNNIPNGGVVIKPARALFGEGVEVYDKLDTYFRSQGGDWIKTEKILERLKKEKFYESLIVQERLHNHSSFNRIGDSRFLQTLRVITFLDEDGTARILGAFLKVIKGDNVTDNWGEGGESGNLVLRIDINSGTPVEVLANDKKLGVTERHTWRDFCSRDGSLDLDFVVPMWKDCIKLCEDLSYAFSPLRIVGWDVAITDDGIFVLEGNYRAGPTPTSEFGNMMEPAFKLHRKLKAH